MRHVKTSARKHEIYLTIHIDEYHVFGLCHFAHLKSESSRSCPSADEHPETMKTRSF